VGISGDQLLEPLTLRNKLTDAVCPVLFNYSANLWYHMHLHQPQNMRFVFSGTLNPLSRTVNRHSVDSGQGMEAMSTDQRDHLKLKLWISGCWNTKNFGVFVFCADK